MPDSPFFSIVIPTYNRGRFIAKTINSVLAQTYSDFEVIIVNDGGTDKTKEVLDQFSDHRIKYYETVNRERGAARNFGVQRASGKYITFLDSDDLLKENHLAVALEFIKQNSAHAIFSLGYDVVSEDGQVIYPWRNLPALVNDKLSEGNFLSCIGVFSLKQILIENPFNEDRHLAGSEDYELWLRLAARYPIHSLPYVTANIVNHDDRSVLNFSPEKLIKRRALLKEYLWNDPQVQRKYGGMRRKVEGYMDLYVALHLAIASYRYEGLKKLMQAFVQYPRLVVSYRFWVVIKKILFF